MPAVLTSAPAGAAAVYAYGHCCGLRLRLRVSPLREAWPPRGRRWACRRWCLRVVAGGHHRLKLRRGRGVGPRILQPWPGVFHVHGGRKGAEVVARLLFILQENGAARPQMEVEPLALFVQPLAAANWLQMMRASASFFLQHNGCQDSGPLCCSWRSSSGLPPPQASARGAIESPVVLAGRHVASLVPPTVQVVPSEGRLLGLHRARAPPRRRATHANLARQGARRR